MFGSPFFPTCTLWHYQYIYTFLSLYIYKFSLLTTRSAFLSSLFSPFCVLVLRLLSHSLISEERIIYIISFCHLFTSLIFLFYLVLAPTRHRRNSLFSPEPKDIFAFHTIRTWNFPTFHRPPYHSVLLCFLDIYILSLRACLWLLVAESSETTYIFAIYFLLPFCFCLRPQPPGTSETFTRSSREQSATRNASTNNQHLTKSNSQLTIANRHTNKFATVKDLGTVCSTASLITPFVFQKRENIHAATKGEKHSHSYHEHGIVPAAAEGRHDSLHEPRRRTGRAVPLPSSHRRNIRAVIPRHCKHRRY